MTEEQGKTQLLALKGHSFISPDTPPNPKWGNINLGEGALFAYEEHPVFKHLEAAIRAYIDETKNEGITSGVLDETTPE